MLHNFFPFLEMIAVDQYIHVCLCLCIEAGHGQSFHFGLYVAKWSLRHPVHSKRWIFIFIVTRTMNPILIVQTYSPWWIFSSALIKCEYELIFFLQLICPEGLMQVSISLVQYLTRWPRPKFAPDVQGKSFT